MSKFLARNFRSTDVVNNLIDAGNIVEVLTSNPNYPEGKIYKGYEWYNFKSEKYKKNYYSQSANLYPGVNPIIFLLFLIICRLLYLGH